MPRKTAKHAPRKLDEDPELELLDDLRDVELDDDGDEDDEGADDEDSDPDGWGSAPPSDELDEKWEDELRRRRSRSGAEDDEAWALYWEHRRLSGDDGDDDPQSREW